MTSIRLRLLKWLIGPILLINLAGASLTYMLAWMPAQQAFDQSLVDAAGALAARLSGGADGTRVDLPRQAEQVLRANDVDAFFFVVRGEGARKLAGDADFPAMAQSGPGAYDDVMRGEPVRTAFRTARVNDEVVQIGVAKTMRKRSQLRSAIVRALVLLETLFTLALVGLIWFSVTNGLLPLERMRASLTAREAGDLSPIDGGAVPYELTPVVGAFNELLDTLQSGAKTQQDFLADMAHQLRTPLAGVKLQLEWMAARHAGDAASMHSVQLMLLSNERMIRQSNQLLALARAEPSRFERTRLEPLDLALLVRESVQVFVDAATRKGIDIGFELEPAMVEGDGNLLRDLVDNLVDNAVRYTPPGGSVTVKAGLQAGRALLTVEDSGPGIALEQRAHVFDRFVRLDDKTTGSGLGLAIVRDIAQAHEAELALGAHESGGARFTVLFPSVWPGFRVSVQK